MQECETPIRRKQYSRIAIEAENHHNERADGERGKDEGSVHHDPVPDPDSENSTDEQLLEEGVVLRQSDKHEMCQRLLPLHREVRYRELFVWIERNDQAIEEYAVRFLQQFEEPFVKPTVDVVESFDPVDTVNCTDQCQNEARSKHQWCGVSSCFDIPPQNAYTNHNQTDTDK